MKLPAILDLGAAAPLRLQLLERRGQALELDCADVERVGGLCLQVLIAARAQWRTDGVGFQIVSASSAFVDAARLMAADDLAPQGGAS